MPEWRPPTLPGSDDDFEIARRAVAAGLCTESQVEAALLAQEREPAKRLVDLLGLDPGVAAGLAGPAKTVPPEVAEAMKDPARRAGNYWIVEKLAGGGMGEVARAWDARLGRWVALKFPRRHESPEARARFVREAQLAARLDHPNIAKAFEVGEIDGKPFLAMQFVRGRTLGEASRDATREQKLRWVRDLAAGVGAAHAGGVIHRDLKPANAMVDDTGHVFVLDFGLARESELADASAGGSRFVAGTPNYMAPEQALGTSDARTDVYGIGAVLFELFAGRPPFVGGTVTEVLLQVAGRDPLPLRRLDPGVSRDVEAIVLRCLEKDPGRRYGSVAELLQDLDACSSGAPLHHARRRTAAYVLARHVRRNPVAWALGGVAALLLLAAGGAGLWWWRSPGTARLLVTPEDAEVTIDGERVPGGAVRTVRLRNGLHRVRAEAPGHDGVDLPLEVVRRSTTDLTLALKRWTGLLDVHADPPDAAVLVDGVQYGSRLVAHRAEAGLRRIEARAPGCFDLAREVEVGRDARSGAVLSLERGELWRYRSDALQAAAEVYAVEDVDGDGVRDAVGVELLDLVILSGATGRVLARERIAEDPCWRCTVVDLGAAGPHVAAWRDAPDGLAVRFYTTSAGLSLAWHWTAPERRTGPPCGVPLVTVEDLDGDGVHEILLLGRESPAWLLNAARRTALPLSGPPSTLRPATLAAGAGFAMSTALGDDDSWTLSAYSLADTRVLWSRVVPARQGIAFSTPHAPIALAVGTTLEAWTPSECPRFRTPLPWPCRTVGMLDSTTAVASGDSGIAGISLKDGSLLWSVPGAPGDKAWIAGTQLFRQHSAGLTCLDTGNGRALFELPGASGPVVAADLDLDGTAEVVVAQDDDALAAVSQTGRRLWTLRIAGATGPRGVLPGREEPRLLFGRGASCVGLARTPRELWHTQAAGPLLAPAVVAGTPEAPVVAQIGDWGRGSILRTFDTRGTPLWSLAREAQPNFPPGVFSRGSGADLLQWSRLPPAVDNALQRLDPRTGAPVASWPLDDITDIYAVPAAADLDGDGTPDPVLLRRLAADVVAFRGAGEGILWKRPLGGSGWGGVLFADVDGDGRADVVVPAEGQPLRALRGTDGAILWECDAARDVRHAPVRLDDQAVVALPDGTLACVDLRTGQARRAIDAGAAPAAAPAIGAGILVVARGSAGIAAWRLPGLEPAWTAPIPSSAAPLLVDLDADGRFETVVSGSSGILAILDAATGVELWSHPIGAEGSVATATAADLDRDGTLDLLVSDRSGRLTALSGRPTRAARRAGR